MSRQIADGLSKKATATSQEARDAIAGKYPDAAGVHEAFNQYGLGRGQPTFTGDVNTLLVPAIYIVSASSATNEPAGAGSGILLVTSGNTDNNRSFQTYHDYSNGRSYTRGWNGTVWTSWQEIFHTGNVATVAENEEGTRNDVPTTPDGVKRYVRQYGIGDFGLHSQVTNLDDITVGGIYSVGTSGVTGHPPGSNFSTSTVVHQSYDSATGTQLFISRLGYDLYFRRKTGGAWQPWVKVFHEENVATTTENQQASRNDVPTTPQGIKEYVDQFIGDSAPVIQGSVDNIVKSGIYTYRDVGGSTGPTPDSLNGLIIHTQYTLSGFAVQLFLGVGSASGYFYTRNNSSGTWSTWEKVITDSDIGTNAARDVIIQTTEPTSGQGNDGDICYVYTP